MLSTKKSVLHGQASSKPGKASWGVQGLGKKWQLAFFRFLIRFGGRRPAYHIMYIVVFWYMLFVPEVRRRTRPYLDRRFPHRRNPFLKFRDSYRLVYTFGRTMIDRAAVAISGPDALDAVCVHEQELRDLANKPGGTVLVNAHSGVWQVALSVLSWLKKPVSIVMIPPDEDSPMAEMARETMPFEIIDPRNGLDSVLEMMQSLRAGRILGVMGDRVFGDDESIVEVDFLGGKMKLPFSPYRLAGAAGAPILVLLSAKVGYRRYEISLARVIHVDAHHARHPAQCRPYAQQFADALEEFVQEYPWQFFNFYNVWEQ